MSFGHAASRGVRRPDAAQPCPCDSGVSFGRCCAPFHRGELAPTAERLMRSRYAAFVVGDVDYIVRTWHPRTRPETVSIDPELSWTGLRIIEAQAGGAADTTGEVEFTASFIEGSGSSETSGEYHERSRFVRLAGKWWYLDRDVG